MYITTWGLYIGSNDLSLVPCQHHKMNVPSVISTFFGLSLLFSSLEDRLKKEAFRSLQDVIQGTRSRLLPPLRKEQPRVETNTSQGEEQQWQRDGWHRGVPATSVGERMERTALAITATFPDTEKET